MELQSREGIAEARLEEIKKLQQSKTQLSAEVERLQMQLLHPGEIPKDKVQRTRAYAALHVSYQQLQAEVELLRLHAGELQRSPLYLGAMREVEAVKLAADQKVQSMERSVAEMNERLKGLRRERDGLAYRLEQQQQQQGGGQQAAPSAKTLEELRKVVAADARELKHLRQEVCPNGALLRGLSSCTFFSWRGCRAS